MNTTENASFQLKRYEFPRFEFDATSLKDGELSIDFDPKGEFKKLERLYTLTLKVCITQGENQVAKVECIASFLFSKEVSLSSIPEFFYPNSIAIIFPYIRAFISLVTTQSQGSGIILPTLNLSGLGKKLEEQTHEPNGANNQAISSCRKKEG